ncbi:MAG: hypothetical protein HQ486_02365 [Acidimicrobiaceae bacterium]|nr:hypothetical protein [Acidimicrobiaceae bacterium]
MFDPVRICEILNEEGVEYIVIGGFAAVIHGSSLPTREIDVLPTRESGNLTKLARALNRIGAMIRTSGDPVSTGIDGPFLANTLLMLDLVTDLGEMNLSFSPSGPFDGYDGWNAQAVVVTIAPGINVRVASLDDIIASKQASDRPKDHRVLPYLESLRDQLQ